MNTPRIFRCVKPWFLKCMKLCLTVEIVVSDCGILEIVVSERGILFTIECFVLFYFLKNHTFQFYKQLLLKSFAKFWLSRIPGIFYRLSHFIFVSVHRNIAHPPERTTFKEGTNHKVIWFSVERVILYFPNQAKERGI